jgi:hypothetical protein
VLLGVLRIIKGWSLTYLIIGGYLGVIIAMSFPSGKSAFSSPTINKVSPIHTKTKPIMTCFIGWFY